MYDYDDFYCEPSEFDEQVEQFKESLRSSVRQEIIQEMEALRKENDSLRDIRDNWKAKVRELEEVYDVKKQELFKATQESKAATENVKNIYFDEILKEVAPVCYRVFRRETELPKCSLCDENRKRKYITPLGRVDYESCTCAQHKIQWHVQKVPIASLATHYRGVPRAYYLVQNQYLEDDLFALEKFCDDIPFQDIYPNNNLFRNENRAKLYAAYMNRKEEEKRRIKSDEGMYDGKMDERSDYGNQAKCGIRF